MGWQMRRIITAQQSLLTQQEETINDLKQLLEAPSPPAKKGIVRPFDAQRAAYTDRRLLGMYDARFHSTHWCALVSSPSGNSVNNVPRWQSLLLIYTFF